jgi:ribosomal protein S18 acetylase RimI-like enzyme
VGVGNNADETAEQMISGRWGKPSQVLLDLTVDEDGSVRGIANPGRQNAQIRTGHFNATTGVVALEGEYVQPNGPATPFRINGRLDGRTLRLKYEFGEQQGDIDAVRVEDYAPKPLTWIDRIQPRIEEFKRKLNQRSRPSAETNARKLKERGESLDSIVFRDAVAADIPALAELHVTTWNATYNTSRGPTVATRTWQWNQVFAIYLRWEYHGLGLGRRMMAETARRFVDRGINSFVLFAELSNPTLGFYDRMGGERLTDDRGQFHGAYAWRDARRLIQS